MWREQHMQKHGSVDSVLGFPVCLMAFCQATQCFKGSINVGWMNFVYKLANSYKDKFASQLIILTGSTIYPAFYKQCWGLLCSLASLILIASHSTDGENWGLYNLPSQRCSYLTPQPTGNGRRLKGQHPLSLQVLETPKYLPWGENLCLDYLPSFTQ